MEDIKEVAYRIRVSTSNIPNNAIKGTVYLQVFGRNGLLNKNLQLDPEDNWATHLVKKKKDHRNLTLIKFPLENALNNKEKFSPGNTDKFQVNFRDFDDIEKIRISHNSISSWHLKKISIKNMSKGLKWNFKCNKWICKLEGSSQIDLYPLHGEEIESSDEEHERENLDKNNPNLDKIKYNLKIKTSYFSKPAESVDLILFGHLCCSKLVQLNNKQSDKNKDKFLDGSLDQFKFEETDVGNVN